VGAAAAARGVARGVVRTTVLNEMSRLVAKGHLVRKRVGGVWQYWPRVQERKLLGEVVRAFVAGALGGSVSPFVAYLSEEGDVTAEELAELKAMVRELEARGKGKR
jgi:predicted transcriptional regulator